MAFAENLKRSRKEKGISQEQLAEMLDVSRQAVSKWEQGIGYPEVEKLVMLSKKLNVSLDALMADYYASESSGKPELSAMDDKKGDNSKGSRKTQKAVCTLCATFLVGLLFAGAWFLLTEQNESVDSVTLTRFERGEVVARYADSLVIAADGVVFQGLGKYHPDAQIYYAFYVDEGTNIENADGTTLSSLWAIAQGMNVEISFKTDEDGKPLGQAGSTYIPFERTDVLALSVKILN